MKSSKVCITTKSTLASLLFKGLATKHTTVNWSIAHVNIFFAMTRSQDCVTLISG